MTAPIIFFGAPGSGKSATAKALSAITGYAFIDTDHVIEKKMGKTISQLFVEDGEESFREVEKETVISLLNSENSVVAVGGGSVIIPEVRDALMNSDAIRIYLEVSLNVVAPRVGFNKDRPLLALNPRASWNALMEKRRPQYEELAQWRYSSDVLSAHEIAEQIAKDLHLPKQGEGSKKLGGGN